MTPQLRFPEFKDAWQVKRLDNIADNGQYGMNAAAKSYDGINKYLRITDIDEDTRKFNHDSLTSPSNKLDSKYLLRNGDLLFARTGASTGKAYLYDDRDGKVYFAGFLIRFHINEANPYFIYTQTLRRNYRKWVSIMSARSGQPGINADEYAKFSISLPAKPEQEKIADFLTAVDERIAASESKCELLARYKRGVMQQLFSQKISFKKAGGGNYPDWQSKNLGEVFEYLRTNSLSRAELHNSGEVMNIHYGDIHTKLGAHFDVETEKVSYLRSINKSDYVQNGDLIIADASEDRFDVGKSTEIINTNGKKIVSGLHTFLARPKNLALGFTGYLMRSEQVRKQLWRIATGASVLGISKTELSKLMVDLPSKEEQQKIADFLTALDDRITAERTKLTAAKQFKKALLQRMFI